MKGRKTTKTNKNGKNGLDVSLPKVVSTFPTMVRRELHATYAFQFANGVSADKCFYVNNAYNPWAGFSANQGYWFDQLAAIYKKCMVLGVRYRVHFNSITAGDEFAIVPNTDITSLSATAPTALLARPDAKYYYYTGRETKVPTINGSIDIKKWLKYNNFLDADNLQSDTASSTLNNVMCLHLVRPSYAHTDDVLIEVWQDTVFFSPVSQAAS